jgi:hypothetical protein
MSSSRGKDETIVRPDTFIAYVVAFILDGIGLLCALMALTVFLLPAVQILQSITAIIGGFFFTLWVVICRGEGIISGAKRGLSSAKKQKKRRFKEDVYAAPNTLEEESPSRPTAIIKTLLKRVVLPFIIENVPILGKILTTWIISVYLETKND